MVSKLQGKFKKTIPGLKVNGVFTSDPGNIAETFADGFITKLFDLSKNQKFISPYRKHMTK